MGGLITLYAYLRDPSIFGFVGVLSPSLWFAGRSIFSTLQSCVHVPGRIYLDIGRNNPGATFVAAYSVRPKPQAPVSAPCTWEEIERGLVGPRTFTIETMAARVRDVGDLWSALGRRRSPAAV